MIVILLLLNVLFFCHHVLSFTQFCFLVILAVSALTYFMVFDTEYATQLGFPKPQYMAVERERRWLCNQFPRDKIIRTEFIKDLYVTGLGYG